MDENYTSATCGDHEATALGFVSAVQAAQCSIRELEDAPISAARNASLGRARAECRMALKLADVHATLAVAAATREASEVERLRKRLAHAEHLLHLLGKPVTWSAHQ